MNIDLDKLPVPKWNRKQRYKPETSEKPKMVKLVKYMDHIFTKQFIQSYFETNPLKKNQPNV